MWDRLRDRIKNLPIAPEDEKTVLARLLNSQDPHAVEIQLIDVQLTELISTAIQVWRHGDLFLGFRLPKDATREYTVTVNIGDRYLDDVTLKPGELALALKDTHVIPLINLAYHRVIAYCKDQETSSADGSKAAETVQLVYALLNPKDRRTLALEGKDGMVLQFPTGYHKFKSGMCGKWIDGQYKGPSHVVSPILTSS